MAEASVATTTQTTVAGYGVPAAAALPAGQALVQEVQPRDVNGNKPLFNPDGSTTVQVESMPAIGSAFQALPTPTTNGAALISGPTGVEITLPAGTSVTYTIAAAQPTSAPTLVRTVSNPSGATAYIADQINCAVGVTVYLTASSGSPFYRSI